MSNLSLREIFNIPQLKYSMYILEDDFFISKLKDRQKIYNETYSSQFDMNDVVDKKYLFHFEDQKDIYFEDNDAYMTAVQTDMTKNIYLKNEKVINNEALLLFLGASACKYLKWVDEVERKTHIGRNEYGYSNGEIIAFNGNKIETNNSNFSLPKEKAKLAEAVLIANNILQSNKRIANRPLRISGTYHERGPHNIEKKETYTSDKLNEFAKSKLVITSLDQNKFDEYIKNNLVKKRDIFRFITQGIISKDVAIDMLIKGVFTKEEVLSNIFKVKSEKDLAMSNQISVYAKILLYSAGKIDVKTLENAVIGKDEQIPKEKFSKLTKYYTKNINKIAELLTHNVLDFTQSMEFLDSLVEKSEISSEDRIYLVEIMNDFKTNELLNNTENKKRKSSFSTNTKVHSHGVTIDPDIRKRYFDSIGVVKEIFVNGQTLIKDESEGVSKKNSLDGYQLIIIPDKKIAVLEKFYEVTRDKSGKIVYKKDEKNNLIASIENATYVMPIAMAKDFTEKKNKQELKKSPYVTSVSHTMNWVQNMELAMQRVSERAGMQIEFKKENTQKWCELVEQNYKILKEKRDQNIDELL